MTPEARLAQINETLEGLRNCWPLLFVLIKERSDALTLDLIGTDSEQTRGRIKELRLLMELPETLTSERDGINADLGESPPHG